MIRERQHLNYIARSWSEAQAIRDGLKCVIGVNVSLRTANAHDTSFTYYIYIEERINKQLLAELDAFARGVAFGRG